MLTDLISTARGGRLRHRLLRVSTVVTLFAATVFGGAGPAAASTGGPYPLLQFNFCGNVDNSACNVSGSTGAPVDALVSTIVGFRPQVVTLNEMCQNQFTALRSRIEAQGWAMNGAFATTRTGTSLNCTDDVYGIGLLSRSALGPSQITCLANCSTPVSQAEQRALLCADVTLHVPTKACVTHIGTSGQAAQIATVAGVVNGYETGMPVVIGGDFNVSPSDDALDGIYATGGGGAAGRFEEADFCAARTTRSSTCNEGTHDRTLGTDPKIDYLFASARDFSALSGDATSATYSDHDPLRATVTQCSTRDC